MLAAPGAYADSAQFDIPAQPLPGALKTFATQGHMQLLYGYDLVRSLKANAVSGLLDTHAALERLLRGTGLKVVYTDENTATIEKSPAPDPRARERTKQASKVSSANIETVDPLQQIIVTGVTSHNRTLLTSSEDITVQTDQDLQLKAPRSTSEIMEMTPGFFVEGTAGPVSNNYSVRGFPGQSEAFIQIEEDGLPVYYSGDRPDRFFQNDIAIERVETVQGGPSGVLTVNGGGAALNFISREPNFEREEGDFRITGTTYSDQRADYYYSAPLAPDLAFNVGGYIDSTKGERDSAFTYHTYHIKSTIEKRFGQGGSIKLTAKFGDEHDPYYADMPFTYHDGSVGGVPSLDPLSGNPAGPDFGNIPVPVSCNNPSWGSPGCTKDFSLLQGIHTRTRAIRLDYSQLFGESWDVFAHAQFMNYFSYFSGIFPGSGSGNAGLTSAYNYLNGGANSPIASLLAAGAAAYPSAAQFGFENLTTGQVIPGADAAALNALNGNGLMQQTVLNNLFTQGDHFASNFGADYDIDRGDIHNTLTVGGMIFERHISQDASGVSTVLDDVKDESDIYNVVALNSAGQVMGSLTDNGIINYGTWGQGIWKDRQESESGYFNNELQIGHRLHIDFGARLEHYLDSTEDGNVAAVNQPLPAGTTSVLTGVGPTFNGTYSHLSQDFNDWAGTLGVNYLIRPDLAAYIRLAKAFQTGTNDYNEETASITSPANFKLYEGGVRYFNHGLTTTLTAFTTIFNGASYGFIDPSNPTITGFFVANLNVKGVQFDLSYSPVKEFRVDAFGVFQQPSLNSVTIDGAAAPQYDGNVPHSTPRKMYTITPAFVFPNQKGQLYVRYKYIGSIYADSGDGLALPGYGVLSAGLAYDLTDQLNLNVSVDNITDVIGLTEGNPRQGNTQSVVGGYFYGRAIFERNAMISMTYHF